MMYGYVYSTILVKSINVILFCTYTINLNIQCFVFINTYIQYFTYMQYNSLGICIGTGAGSGQRSACCHG